MHDVQIRDARGSDRAGILEVRSSSTDLRDDLVGNRLLMQQSGAADYLVLLVDRRISGFVVLKWGGNATHPEHPYVEDLYVSADLRGSGLGTALLAECERRVQARGGREIGLAVNPIQNARARDLYERLGYRHDGRADYVDQIIDGVEDRVIDMSKALGSPQRAGLKWR